MNLLRLYHALPASLRSLVASARGWELRAWRYGPDTDRLVQAALERETWSRERWDEWRPERLAQVLSRAVHRVPHYRASWGHQSADERPPWNELRHWPILTKAELRCRPEAFLAEDCDRRRIFCEHTSGSTGTPLTLWQSRTTLREWYALVEARWRRWYGVSRHDRWAILGGQLVVPFKQQKPPFWVWNAPLHQLYLSASHVAAPNAAAYVEAMKQYRVTYLWAYPSSAHALAQFLLEKHLRAPELKAVITNAEPLYEHQRRTISEAFRCPVFETYGMCELACAASECSSGRLHLWPEVGVWEVLDDEESAVPPERAGRLVVTGLLNADMPLIRYEVGDRVVLANPKARCPCGRTLPVLRSVEGRNDDLIVTSDGRRLGRLDPVFKGDLPIAEAQIVQESLECLRVLLVPAQGFAPEHARVIVERLRERVGNLDIRIEKRTALPRSANGKFRAVVSHVSDGSFPSGNGSAVCFGPKAPNQR